VGPVGGTAGQLPGVRVRAGLLRTALFSKTTDFGKTWSRPQVIVGLPSLDQTIGNQIVVDRQTGALYDFFNLIRNASNVGGTRGYNVAFVKSTDGGATWSAPKVVAALDTAGVSDPNNLDPETNAPPAPSRTGDIIPEPAINPNTGQLYVVWQDSRFNGFANDEVVISTSSNGGATWSAPELVNVHTGQPAYDPSVYVNAAGAVGVSYFQWSGTVSGNEPTTLHLSDRERPVRVPGRPRPERLRRSDVASQRGSDGGHQPIRPGTCRQSEAVELGRTEAGVSRRALSVGAREPRAGDRPCRAPTLGGYDAIARREDLLVTDALAKLGAQCRSPTRRCSRSRTPPCMPARVGYEVGYIPSNTDRSHALRRS
jgi:hypothetical protein